MDDNGHSKCPRDARLIHMVLANLGALMAIWSDNIPTMGGLCD